MKFRRKLWLDFETRSRVNLKRHGAYRYVECPDHRILIAAWALDDGPVQGAIVNGALPLQLRNALDDPKVQIYAHSAAFDRLQLGKSAPPIERWYCTASQARAMALPAKLEDLGRATGADLRKDPRGAQLIQLLSIPRADGTFNNDPRLMAEFLSYCKQDVAVMREISKSMPALREEDLEAYHISERINDRGLPIDTELCKLALDYAAEEKREAELQIAQITLGALRKATGTTLTAWVYDRLDPILAKHMEVVRKGMKGRRKKGSGEGGEGGEGRLANSNSVSVPDELLDVEKGVSLTSDIRAQLLEVAEDNPEAIDPQVLAVIEANDAAALTSVGKFQAMLDRVCADGRLRGAFIFNGAYQTNRWSSTGAQVHNYPRLVAPDPEAVLKLMRRRAKLPGGTLRTLKSMLRPAIAPRSGFVVRADWNAVEARGLPWLVNTPLAERYLDAFRDPTRDIYVEQSKIAGLGGERQPGKVVVLSMGYGGAEGALARMAKNYGVTITQREAVVRNWRAANGWVADRRTGWWYLLKTAATRALLEPGTRIAAGRVSLAFDGYSLTMSLPSGRTLFYPKARYQTSQNERFEGEITYLKAAWRPTKDAVEWPRARLWHGTLAENATQAMCNDLLRGALIRGGRQGLPLIGHVHDEIVAETTSLGESKEVAEHLSRAMLELPPWAAGLPLAVGLDTAPRFRK